MKDELIFGEKAIIHATEIYNNISKLKQKVKADNLKTTPLLEYFESITSQGMPPKKLGFLKTREN